MNRSAVETHGDKRKTLSSARGRFDTSAKSGAPTGGKSKGARNIAGKHLGEVTRPLASGARVFRRSSALLLTGLSLLACCLMFPPVNWGWLGYVCLVPWLVSLCTFSSAPFIYFLSGLL